MAKRAEIGETRDNEMNGTKHFELYRQWNRIAHLYVIQK
jgi:hypothetical protein